MGAREADDDAGQDDSQREQGVRGHVQERGARVDVALVVSEHPCAEAADEDAGTGRPGDGGSVHGRGLGELGDALGKDDADGDKQDQGVDEGDPGGDPAEARFMLALPECEAESYEGDDQREDVDQFVPGVGHEPEGVAEPADHHFQDDESQVEGDGDPICFFLCLHHSNGDAKIHDFPVLPKKRYFCVNSLIKCTICFSLPGPATP